MLCTASVEEVIDGHYQNQLNQLHADEKNLKEKIKKFRDEEIHHKNIAYDNGASKEGLYYILDKIIKTGSKVAINISEKI
jgi:ubiquinone biosynthesis monooxygenase Coq7